MARFTTRRFVGDVLRVVGKSWEASAQEVQEWAEKVLNHVTGGIPPGFNDLTPTTVDGVTPADAGTEESGWAAADHQHDEDISGTPGAIGSVSAQGAGPGNSLSGHTHAFTAGDHVILTIASTLPHDPRIPKAQAGTSIMITENALGPVISTTAVPTADDANNIIANQVFGG